MALEDQGLEDLVLRMPAALRDRVEETAARECLSLNLFVLMAVAEKLQRLQLQQSFATERDELASGMNAISNPVIH